MIERKIVLLFIFLVISSTMVTPFPDSKLRLVVLTDIENEPDDAQSMVRLLSYSKKVMRINLLLLDASCPLSMIILGI